MHRGGRSGGRGAVNVSETVDDRLRDNEQIKRVEKQAKSRRENQGFLG